MAEKKNYLVVAECSGFENHSGERWIDEEELNQIKQQTGNIISEGCSSCKITVKDAEGNVLFTKEGC